MARACCNVMLLILGEACQRARALALLLAMTQCAPISPECAPLHGHGRALVACRHAQHVTALRDRRCGGGIAPDVVSFNAVVAAFAADGELDSAMAVITAMPPRSDRNALPPQMATYVPIMRAALERGQAGLALEVWHTAMRACAPLDTEGLNLLLYALVVRSRHVSTCARRCTRDKKAFTPCSASCRVRLRVRGCRGLHTSRPARGCDQSACYTCRAFVAPACAPQCASRGLLKRARKHVRCMQEPGRLVSRWWDAVDALSAALRAAALQPRAALGVDLPITHSAPFPALSPSPPLVHGLDRRQSSAPGALEPSIAEQIARTVRAAPIAPDTATLRIMMAAALREGEPRAAMQLCSALVARGAVPDVGCVNLQLHAHARLREWLPALQVLRSAYDGVGVDGESFSIAEQALHEADAAAAAGWSVDAYAVHQAKDEVRFACSCQHWTSRPLAGATFSAACGHALHQRLASCAGLCDAAALARRARRGVA